MELTELEDGRLALKGKNLTGYVSIHSPSSSDGPRAPEDRRPFTARLRAMAAWNISISHMAESKQISWRRGPA